MKRIITLTLCGLLATGTAFAEPNKKEKKARRQAEKAEQQAAKANRQAAKANQQANRQSAKIQAKQSRAQIKNQQKINRSGQIQAKQQIKQQKKLNRAAAIANNNNGNIGNRKLNRRSKNEIRRLIQRPNNYQGAWTWNEARRWHKRQRHNRSWWTSNFTRFAIFAGGYYYWDRGYWYPAYGYDTRYNNYIYDEPIYGYNYMEPRQVVINVQLELRRQGYYYGSIDGLIGPMTRSALARFQVDHGMYVSRSIDGPTLAALRLVS